MKYKYNKLLNDNISSFIKEPVAICLGCGIKANNIGGMTYNSVIPISKDETFNEYYELRTFICRKCQLELFKLGNKFPELNRYLSYRSILSFAIAIGVWEDDNAIFINNNAF